MKSICKLLALVLCVGLLMSFVPTAWASSDDLFVSFEYARSYEIKAKIEQIMGQINNRYWNGKINFDTKANREELIDHIKNGDYSYGTTQKPCSRHNDGCTSNKYGGGTQCNGFARYLAYAVFGVDFNTKNNTWVNYRGQNVEGITLKPGDIIYMFPGNKIPGQNGVEHWTMVWYVDGNRIYTAGGNQGGLCKIEIGTVFDINKVMSEAVASRVSINRPKCNLIDDPTPDSPNLTVTANDATNVTSNSATLTGFIHYGNYQPSEWGIDITTNEKNWDNSNVSLTKKHSISIWNGSGTNISVNFATDVAAENNPLKASTTYFYRFWAKYGEDQFEHSKVKQFTTPKNEPSFSPPTVSKGSGANNIVLKSTVTWPSTAIPLEWGVDIATKYSENSFHNVDVNFSREITASLRSKYSSGLPVSLDFASETAQKTSLNQGQNTGIASGCVIR